jgi:hypothetical protein
MGKRILLIEPSPTLRAIFAMYFQRDEHQLVLFEDYEDAAQGACPLLWSPAEPRFCRAGGSSAPECSRDRAGERALRTDTSHCFDSSRAEQPVDGTTLSADDPRSRAAQTVQYQRCAQPAGRVWTGDQLGPKQSACSKRRARMTHHDHSRGTLLQIPVLLLTVEEVAWLKPALATLEGVLAAQPHSLPQLPMVRKTAAHLHQKLSCLREQHVCGDTWPGTADEVVMLHSTLWRCVRAGEQHADCPEQHQAVTRYRALRRQLGPCGGNIVCLGEQCHARVPLPGVQAYARHLLNERVKKWGYVVTCLAPTRERHSSLPPPTGEVAPISHPLEAEYPATHRKTSGCARATPVLSTSQQGAAAC